MALVQQSIREAKDADPAQSPLPVEPHVPGVHKREVHHATAAEQANAAKLEQYAEQLNGLQQRDETLKARIAASAAPQPVQARPGFAVSSNSDRFFKPWF
jgi:hypothetical protein